MARLAGSNRVVFGATVDLEDQDDGGELVYQIVGEDEADIRRGLDLHHLTHCARARRQEQGDVIEVVAPGGTRTYEIIGVKYV